MAANTSGVRLVAQAATSGATSAQADGVGSIRLLTDASGNQAGNQTFDAYGASRSHSGTQLALGYAGQQTDPESGLQYLHSREYAPSTGRFLSADPLASIPGWQGAYGYAGDAPSQWADPSGLCFPICNIVAGVIGGVVSAGVELGGQVVANHGFNNINWGNVAVAAATGAAAGALGPLGAELGLGTIGSLGITAAGGAAANAAQYASTSVTQGANISLPGLGTSAALGGLGAALGGVWKPYNGLSFDPSGLYGLNPKLANALNLANELGPNVTATGVGRQVLGSLVPFVPTPASAAPGVGPGAGCW